MKLQDGIAKWLKEYLAVGGADGFVLGLSGDVDSANTAALAVWALGPELVLAAMLPFHSDPIDARLAADVIKSLEMPRVTVNLDKAYESLLRNPPRTGYRLATADVKPRLFMTALYCLGQTRNYLMWGCRNQTELLAGYSTKYGDASADLLPLGGFSKTEIRVLARELDLTGQVLQRPPSADLWPGQYVRGGVGNVVPAS